MKAVVGPDKYLYSKVGTFAEKSKTKFPVKFSNLLYCKQSFRYTVAIFVNIFMDILGQLQAQFSFNHACLQLSRLGIQNLPSLGPFNRHRGPMCCP